MHVPGKRNTAFFALSVAALLTLSVIFVLSDKKFAAYIKLQQTDAPRDVEEEFLTHQLNLLMLKKIPQTCDFDALAYPVRIQKVVSPTGCEYKSFLHAPNVDKYISEHQWHDGVPGKSAYEADYHKEFLKSINRIREIKGKQEITILDIGANIGVHSMFFALQGAKVHSFEPSVVNFKLLQCSAFANKLNNIILNNVALSDVSVMGDGWCMKTPYNENQGHKVLTQDCGQLKSGKKLESTRTIRLDSYWAKVLQKSRVDMIKIDVEGHELQAFTGALEMLRKAPPYVIYAEFQPKAIRKAGMDPLKFLQIILDYGYIIEPSRRDPGFRTRRINNMKTAKEFLDFIEGSQRSLLDLVFKHQSFVSR